MTDARTYPPGVPSWIDTEPPDRDATIDFYGGLFGWTFEDVMPPGLPGYYVIARLDGQDVAGLGSPAATPTSYWNTYVAVEDADDAARAVADAGGRSRPRPRTAGPGAGAQPSSTPPARPSASGRPAADSVLSS